MNLRALQKLAAQLDVCGVDTNSSKAKLAGFVAELCDLILGSVGLEQSVVDQFGDICTNVDVPQRRSQSRCAGIYHLLDLFLAFRDALAYAIGARAVVARQCIGLLFGKEDQHLPGDLLNQALNGYRIKSHCFLTDRCLLLQSLAQKSLLDCHDLVYPACVPGAAKLSLEPGLDDLACQVRAQQHSAQGQDVGVVVLA